MKKLLAILAATTVLVGPALAQDITEFRIGLLGGENAQDRLTSNECLRAAVEKDLGVPTKLFAPADYDGVIQGLLGGTIDMAWLGPSAYAKIVLTDPKAVDLKLITVNADGSQGYYSIGIARKDSGITDLATAKGKTFAFADPNSTSGYLVPAVEMKAQLGEDLEKFFSKVTFSGGHEQTIVGVANKQFDAGVTWADGLGNFEDGYTAGALRKAVDAGLVNMNDLVQIWKSDLIPNGPMVVRAALPADVKDKVTALMEALPQTDMKCAEGVAAGAVKAFVPVGEEAYKSIIEARKLQDSQKS